MRHGRKLDVGKTLFALAALSIGTAQAGGGGVPMGGPPKGPDAPALMKKTTNEQRWASATRQADRRAEAMRKNTKAQRKGGK